VIEIVAYDLSWPQTFQRLRDRIWPVVSDLVVSIEHVGSTAVPGLAAKPIIDMVVVAASRAAVPVVIERLASLGYVHRGNLGIADRDAFAAPPLLPRHHLYLCPVGVTPLRNFMCFRDHLRADANAAARYADLKKDLATRHTNDAGRYTCGKTTLLLDILRDAGFTPEELQSVAEANRERNE
jgi:GrpB-like predicted nucleotidyltransferase (UPF0157 family)